MEKDIQEYNLNYGVWFHVTEYGEVNMTERQSRFLKNAKTREIDGKTYYWLQMYDVMNLFGEHLYCGCNPPISPTIYLEFE